MNARIQAVLLALALALTLLAPTVAAASETWDDTGGHMAKSRW